MMKKKRTRARNAGLPCAVRACDRPAHCKGLCESHYKAHQQGRAMAPVKPKHLGSTRAVFTRVSDDLADRLEREAKRLGYESLYAIAATILERWDPATTPPAPAPLTE